MKNREYFGESGDHYGEKFRNLWEKMKMKREKQKIKSLENMKEEEFKERMRKVLEKQMEREKYGNIPRSLEDKHTQIKGKYMKLYFNKLKVM